MIRIVFPAVAANGSAVTILGSFVEVLGRKIDQCEDAIDPGLQLSLCTLHPSRRTPFLAVSSFCAPAGAIGSHEQPSPGDARPHFGVGSGL